MVWRRVSRALETLSRPHLDKRAFSGAQGEAEASRVLALAPVLSQVTNPIIPAFNGRTRTLEADFLVYTQGNLFCIEIKRWKGRISYDVSAGQQEKHAPDLLQEKRGAYGEHFPPQTHTNPLKKTKTFIWHLKRSLAEHIDPRFENLFIVPVVAFLDEADISALHSLQEGMIAVSELPAFFERHHDLAHIRAPSRWMIEGIQHMPTSDQIVTTDHHPFKGFLTDDDFVFHTREGETHHFPYAQIRSIWLHHIWLFSEDDPMTIFFTDDSFRECACVSGIVQMTDLGDKPSLHRLRNVESIAVGRANKPVRPHLLTCPNSGLMLRLCQFHRLGNINACFVRNPFRHL